MPINWKFGVLLLSLAAVAAWFLTGHKPGGPTDSQASPTTDQSVEAGAAIASHATEAPNDALASQAPATRQGARGSGDLKANAPEAEHEAYVAKRVAELQDLGMENDSASLDTILSELGNADPSIRQAAIDAAVQFGSREAIPKLTTAAAQAADPKEQSAILDAVEFLKMPTLAEALAPKNSSPPAATANTPPAR